MKKVLFYLGITFLYGQGFSQNIDSLSAVKAVDSLIEVSRSLTAKRSFDAALEANALAEKIVLEKLGEASVAFGDVCYNHGRVSHYKGDFAAAEKWYLESRETRAKVLGKEHPDYAWSLNNLAVLYWKMGNYEQAEQLYLEAKDIREKALGKEHPDYAVSVNNLAILYRELGNYIKAEPLYLEAIRIREKTNGKEHPLYAATLNNLANLYREMGNFEIAASYFQEAKNIREKTLGKEHPDYAASVNNLAILYQNMGNYEKAEPLYLEAKDILEKTLGKDHYDYAMGVNNLAALYRRMGDNKKAESLLLEAKDIREKNLGKDHPDYASSLNNLAELYLEMGNQEKAELYLLESRDIREKALGKEHPKYAGTLSSLAGLYQEMGEYEKAEMLNLEAQSIQEKVLGKEHPKYAATLNNLAVLYLKTGKYEKAEPLLLKAKDIREKAIGREHADYGESLHDLAMLYLKTGRISEASKLLLELDKLNRRLVERAMAYLSENQILAYQKTFEAKLAEYQSFTQGFWTPELSRESYNDALFYNGLTQENNRLLARAIAGADSLTLTIYAQWQGCHRRLAKRYARPIADNKKIASVEVEAEGYEKQIIRNLPAFQKARKIPQWQQVCEQLQPGEAAVEFIHYRYYSPNKTDSIMYAALLLRPGWEAPQFIPLFEEKSLDSLLAPAGGRKADYVAKLYSVAGRGVIKLGAPSKSLYELLWQAIDGKLSGVQKVYYAPSGLMHRLNLAAVPIAADSTLADSYHLVELGSTRQLIGKTSDEYSNNNAMLFGGIQYDMDSSAIFMAIAELVNQDIASRGATDDEEIKADPRGGAWNYLKWTEKEVDAVGSILSAGGFSPKIRKGFEATEETFKSIGKNGPAPRVLHIATHGFFFPDPKDTLKQQRVIDEYEVGFKTSDNPLIRSGLLFAGANQAWKTGKPFKKGMENGILTAYEISHMDLSNTELVVLSACETGLGDIEGNEGVYGLQRAFKIAGAKYLIMSLWQVPDKETKAFMVTFYKNWLEEKMPIPEAFHVTQNEMRERFINPYAWAGFVLVE